jgi:hypothetical protein
MEWKEGRCKMPKGGRRKKIGELGREEERERGVYRKREREREIGL